MTSIYHKNILMISGVTCAETLAFYQPDHKILLISESSLIKTVTNLLALTQTLTQFDIEEKDANSLTIKHPNITVIHDVLKKINVEENQVHCLKHVVKYEYLCLCTGAKPKLIPQAENNPFVIGIRDTDSVDNFIKKLSNSRKVLIIGNGGIASEIVYKLKNVDIDWVIKDNHISATFVDPGASEFFKPSLEKGGREENLNTCPSKRMRLVAFIYLFL